MGLRINNYNSTYSSLSSPNKIYFQRAYKYEIYFSGLNDLITDVFKRTGLYTELGEDHFFRNASMAIAGVHSTAHTASEEKECPLLNPVKIK